MKRDMHTTQGHSEKHTYIHHNMTKKEQSTKTECHTHTHMHKNAIYAWIKFYSLVFILLFLRLIFAALLLLLLLVRLSFSHSLVQSLLVSCVNSCRFLTERIKCCLPLSIYLHLCRLSDPLLYLCTILSWEKRSSRFGSGLTKLKRFESTHSHYLLSSALVRISCEFLSACAVCTMQAYYLFYFIFFTRK